MSIKLASSQTCVWFPFTTAGPPLFPEEKNNNPYTESHYLQEADAGKQESITFSVCSALESGFIFLWKHCTTELRFLLVETKQMLRVREACNTRQLFLMSAVKLHPSVPGEIRHIIPFSFPSDEFRDTEWLNQRRQEWVGVRANVSAGIFLWAWLSWVTLSQAQYIASA